MRAALTNVMGLNVTVTPAIPVRKNVTSLHVIVLANVNQNVTKINVQMGQIRVRRIPTASTGKV